MIVTPLNTRDVILTGSTIRTSRDFLTIEEKPSLINQIKTFSDTKVLLDADADKYLVSVEKSTHTSNINNLLTFLGTLVNPVAWNNLSNITKLDRSSLDTRILACYTSQMALTTAISTRKNISARLTVPTVAVPAASDGTVTVGSLNTSGGTLKVYNGTLDITIGNSIVYSIISSTGCSVSINSATGVYLPTAITSDTASCVIRATLPVAFGSMVIDLIFTLSKARAGSNGTTGVDARLITVSSTSQIFQIPKSGSVAPSTISLTAVRNNLAANPTWSVISGTGTLTSVSGDSATLLFSNMLTDTVTIKVTDSTGTYFDTITIVKVREGVDSIVGYLTNESSTVPATAEGVVTSYSTANGNFVVYYGAANVTSLCTFSIISNTGGLTPSASINSSGYYSISGGMGSDSANITYRASYTSPTGVVYTIDKIFSLSKSRVGSTGPAGLDAKLISLSSTSQVFQISKTNNVLPSSITLTSSRGNVSGSVFSIVYGSGILTSVSGDTATLQYSDMSTDVITVKVSDSTSTYHDTLTIIKVREGEDSIHGYLTNESVTLPASPSGTVSSYAGATGNFIVYIGSQNITSLCTFSVLSNVDSLTPYNSIVSSGASAGQYGITSGMSAVEVSKVVYRASYTNYFGQTVHIDKVFSITKSKTGATGATGAAGSTGSAGATGATGSSARIAYVKTSTTLSPTPAVSTVTGDTPPTSGTWGEVDSWQAYPPTIGVNEQVWQTTGTYNYITNQTTWVTPYLSNLKVGNLSALTVNTGNLTVNTDGYIKGGQTDYNVGDGFWLGYKASTYKLSIGSSSGARMIYDGTALSVLMPMGVIEFGNTTANRLLSVNRQVATALPSVFLTDSSNSSTETLYVTNSSGFSGANLASFYASKGRALSLYSASTVSECLKAVSEYSTSPAATFSNISLGTELSVGGSYAAYAGSGKGKIYAVDGAGPFTGFHQMVISSQLVPEIGDIVCVESVVHKHDINNAVLRGVPSSKVGMRTSIGVFSGLADFNSTDTLPLDMVLTLSVDNELINVNSLGEGLINVCAEGGDIKPGDLIQTSSTLGKGMKAPDNISYNRIVAKSCDTLSFDRNTRTGTIACIYLCG